MNSLPSPPKSFGIVMHTDHNKVEYPIDENRTLIKHTLIVWVDIGLPPWQVHIYTAWIFKDGMDEFGPVRGFDVPFDGVGDWDPVAIPLPDGELTSAEISLAQSGHHPAAATPSSSMAELDLVLEES